VATTAGRGQENLAWEIVDYARKVARGEIENPAFLPILFEADRDADWQDEALWHRVNPGLAHGYPSIEGLRTLAREAKDRPGDRDAFKQLHLCIWGDRSTEPFVDMKVFDEGAVPIDLEALQGRPCWLGVDMSMKHDLTAVVAAFPDDDEGYDILCWFFCPGNSLRARADRDGVPYPQWAEEGFITPTPGDIIDYRAVEARIREICEQFDVREIAFDEKFAQPVMAPLLEDDFPVVTMPLDVKSQAAGLISLERPIISRKLRHGGHPVLRWCFANVETFTGFSGLRTMHKGKSRDRIDGAFATWMAVARAAAGESTTSIYDDATARPEGLLVI
jgi:phage terminase large subunit-like protein